MGDLRGLSVNMIVRYGTLIAQASGALGGIVLSNRRGQPTASLRPHRVARNTAPQVTQQAAAATAAHGYQNLSTASKIAWALYAAKTPRQSRLGVARKLSPFQCYVAQNTLRANIGAALRTTPPTKGMSGPGYPTSVAFSAGGPYTLELLSPSTDPTGYYVVYGHRPCSTLRIGRQFRRLVYSEHVNAAMSVDLEPYWTAIFGTMASGELYWLAVRYLGDNSLASALWQFTGTVI
jgi:hypothetical protein